MAGATTSYRVPKRWFRSDGSVLQGELSAILLRDTDGAPLHFIMQVIRALTPLIFQVAMRMGGP